MKTWMILIVKSNFNSRIRKKIQC